MKPKPLNPIRYRLWVIAVSFVLLQFFLQLSSGVILGAIMSESHFSAFKIGLLASAFYYVYTSLQVPVGLIYDRFSVKIILILSISVCSLGCFIFAVSYNFNALFIGRLLMGGGSAFAFVGLAHILRSYFPLRDFSFLIGISETLGFLATVLGMIIMGKAINFSGWRIFISGAGVFCIAIAVACWWIYPVIKNKFSKKHPPFVPALLRVISNKGIWINSIFVSLSFTVITVFGALWAVPFLQTKLQCTLATASTISAMIFAGAAISCPLFGKLAVITSNRRLIIIVSCTSTALLEAIFLYVPSSSLILHGTLLFLTGLCCGGYLLSFSISNELATPETLSTCTGFTNTLAMLSAPILQPFIGYCLDKTNPGSDVFTLWDYQNVLFILPICLITASILGWFLPQGTNN